MPTERFLLFLGLGALAAVCVPAPAAPAAASNPIVYQAGDTTPDAPGAPDVSTVTVSDTTAGLITLQISFVPGTEHDIGDSYSVYIDSDQNPTTGDISGAGTDYLLQYDGTEGGGLGLYKWDGKSSYAPVDKTSLQGSFSGDSQYFVIAASELGITDGFNFNVAAAVGSDASTSSAVDFVPEGNTNLHYAMQNRVQAAVKLSLSDWEYTTPHAGKPFVTLLLVKRSDTGAILKGGATIKCKLAVAGKTVSLYSKGFQAVPWRTGGSKTAAGCDWHLPAGSAGKGLVATESVTLGTSTVAKSFAYTIRK